MPHPASLQEDLNLNSDGRFTSTIAVEDLGLDPSILDMLTEAGPLCFLDFEATGLEPESDDLIEAGAVRIEHGEPLAHIFNTHIHTELHLSPFIQRLTGISPSDIKSAPSLDEVAEELQRFIGTTAIVAHNAKFEQSWLAKRVNASFDDHRFLDTLELLALVYPDSPNMKLDTFCKAKLARKERHRALDDALDTLRITANVFEEARDGFPEGHNAYAALRRGFASSPWTERLENLPGSSVRRTRIDASESLDPPKLSEVPMQFDDIAERLTDEETARSVIAGYEHRPAQIELLAHAYNCFAGKQGKTVTICEAGTGIGKTLAYLSVAIPFARQTGEQVIVSTSSKLLQRQLMEKDIPAAAALMGYSDLRFTSIKGRRNYVCRSRLNRFLDKSLQLLPPTDEFALAYVEAFSESAGHGEVDRIPAVLQSMHPVLERYGREITSGDASECNRQTCETTQGDCVFREARARLESAEIIVVNHDLLLRWPPDYPALRHLVIDEVHELAERADGAYARSVDAVDIGHRLGAMLEREARDKLEMTDDEINHARDAVELIERTGREAISILFDDSAADKHGYRDELAVPIDGPGPTWAALCEASSELGRTLEALGRSMAARAEDDESPTTGVAEALLDAATVLNGSLPKPPTDLVVRFRGLARKIPTTWRLVATPVSPAADFQLEILDSAETLFGTSATVTVGGDSRGALGLLELPERAGSRYLLAPPVESPFDYANNLEVLFINERTDRETLVEKTVHAISSVATRCGGRTMGLFTSRDRLNAASDLLFSELAAEGITIISPATGGADPHDLVRTFMETEHGVLLGARAFWQGVDIPGNACEAIVIEKLPFDVPGDPLIQRRSELVESEGGNSFMDYMLPRMLLRLKQMVGRLIRTPEDRGVVVLVESRADRRYFPKLLGALPPDARHAKIKLADVDARIADFFAEKN